MTEPTPAARASDNQAEFNTFLYAGIVAEENGSMLSVLSAMARMNLDPWQEAASLAALPGRAAHKKLTVLIAALPGMTMTPAEQVFIAERLVKLLPRHGLVRLPPPQPSRSGIPQYLQGVTSVLLGKSTIYVVIVLILLALGASWFVADKPPASSPRSTTFETAAKPNAPSRH